MTRDHTLGTSGDSRLAARAATRLMDTRTAAPDTRPEENPVDLNRFHIDRVSDYAGTFPERHNSGTLRFSETSDYSRLNNALCVAVNLHNPQLTAALTKNRSTGESADDLERIAGRDDVDEPTRQSMRRVARILREHVTEEAP